MSVKFTTSYTEQDIHTESTQHSRGWERCDRLTIREIKKINREISQLKSKLIRLDAEATKTTQTISDMPGVVSVSDKVGNMATQIADIQREIQNLEIYRNSALNRLSNDKFEENCLFMRLSLRYSWTKIALQVGGDNTADGVRKLCERYSW